MGIIITRVILLAAATGAKFDVVQHRTCGDACQGQGVTNLDLGPIPRHHFHPDP
jgi:hypothetical protein